MESVRLARTRRWSLSYLDICKDQAGSELRPILLESFTEWPGSRSEEGWSWKGDVFPFFDIYCREAQTTVYLKPMLWKLVVNDQEQGKPIHVFRILRSED